MFMWTCSLVALLVPILINVAFFTLLERKILGLSQSRKGPNKVSHSGLLQPIADAVKLFLKESTILLSWGSLFLVSPSLALFLMLLAWQVIPGGGEGSYVGLSAIVLLVILSLGLYPLLLAGWSSNSKYALLGALRGVAQTISYEISLALILMAMLVAGASVSLSAWESLWSEMPIWAWALPLFFMWVISCVAETNRTPFDFAEGESELVSGFNVEYGAGGFALIFMAEYGSIMFLSALSAILLTGHELGHVSMIGVTAGLCFFWVWVRATLPRFRYDKLMAMAWKSLLPASIAWLTFSAGAIFN